MDHLRLPIFPEGGLDASVITTVWIGVWVVAFFNLRLGWTFSGLVVPGYMVPLFLLKPWSAGVMCLEGALTYLLVWFLSEMFARWRIWGSFFGRDRYFALLLVSIVVRIGFDVWLLPFVGTTINKEFRIEFDYHNNLHNFGLIIIPLIANQFWKPGLIRGVIPMAVTIGVTYLLIRYGLMEFTNFSMGNLQYMYSEIAYDFLASPKAYIISIATAWLASRMNQDYAWEYHGIHIPALLALQWYEPLKIVSTFVEAGVVFGLASALLHAPVVRNISFEGARKVVFFFTVGFAWKMGLGFVLHWAEPGLKISDFYGFGYMLSTLMAVKAYEKGIPARVVRAVLQVSLVGVAASSLIGFALTYVPWGWLRPPDLPSLAEEVATPEGRLIEVVRRERVALYQQRLPGSMRIPRLDELAAFERGIRELARHVQDRASDSLEQARVELRLANYQVAEVEQRYLLVEEIAPARGWGLFVLDRQNPRGLVVEVPAPLDEWAVIEAGTMIFQSMEGRALAIAGSSRKTNRDSSSDMLANPRSIYQTFHRVLGRRDVLQVRGYTPENLRLLAGGSGDEGGDPSSSPSTLWVKAALPPGLNLATLRHLLGSYPVRWEPAPIFNVQRDATRAEFAELFLNRTDRRNLLARSVLEPREPKQQVQLQRQEGNLAQWLLGRKLCLAEAGTNLYQPATQEEMLFFDQEVLTPLLDTLQTRNHHGELSPGGVEELRAVATAARIRGYDLIQFRDLPSEEEFLILAEPLKAPRQRFWGTYVFRMGPGKPCFIQVPRPRFEPNSFEYGIALFDRLKASALLLAGAASNANQDGSADLIQVRNKVNLLNLAAQVLLREAKEKPLMQIQSRTFGLQPNGTCPEADVLLAFDNGAARVTALTPLGQELYAALEADHLKVQFIDGSFETAPFGIAGQLQSSYLTQTKNKELAVLWLSPLSRTDYRQQAENLLQQSHFRVLKVPTVEAHLHDHLARLRARRGTADIPPEARRLVEQYIADQDIVPLYSLVARWKSYRFEHLLDPGTQQAFLVIQADPANLPLVANLGPRDPGKPSVFRGDDCDPETIRQFMYARATWLEVKTR